MSATQSAAAFLGGAAAAQASAPGRVNLLGEHTDYNDGFMLPLATPQRTEVLLASSGDGQHHAYSATLGMGVTFAPASRAPEGFARYLEGCIRLVEQHGATVPPLRIYVRSNVPPGVGLASSAALEVAMLRALRVLLGLELDNLTVARLAQRAEIEFAGVHCGIMDQMAASLGAARRMLFIDARSLAWRLVALPARSEVVVVDSGVVRTLAASDYNLRRAECREAARMLGVAALRDVDPPSSVEALASPWRERARHVVSENLRVREAADGVDGVRFGALMNDSHASLRDDFAVSLPQLDRLCVCLRAQRGVFGARLTGAGFGGACVALCEAGQGAAVAAGALACYGASGHVLMPAPSRLEGA